MKDDLADARSYRLSSIDAIRGLVIVVMTLDHVRDFFSLASVVDPMADPNITVGRFVTRWITHFCAPVFVLVAGVSAGLILARKTKKELSWFLLTRGLWLIAVEWFVISTALTFSPFGSPEIGGKIAVGFQVIWAIGASMIVLSATQFLGRRYCLVIGVVILCCHNLLDPFWPQSTMELEGIE
ncbi:MAG: heparan-alpha-glucosaminide N-acetyltransferase domain-containing protein, partial [Pirellulaceae bacterium]